MYDNGRIVNQFRTHERVGTVYGGWSAGLRDGWVTRWTVGMTSDERQAQAIDPATTPGPLPTDHKLVYPWLGVGLVWAAVGLAAWRGLRALPADGLDQSRQ